MRRRIEGTVSEAAYEFFQGQCLKHDRGASYALDKIILHALNHGLDLSSVQARETADGVAAARERR